MSILEEAADIIFHPVTALWSIFGVASSFILFFVTFRLDIFLGVFYGFLGVLCIAGFVFQQTTFKDTKESSVDWNEETDEVKVGFGTLIGLVGLFGASFFIAVLSGVFDLTQVFNYSALWVPRDIYLASQLPIDQSGFYGFALAVFATFFSIIPGEQNLQIMFTPLFKAYEHVDWISNLPFPLQPAIMVGVGVWSAMHTVLGQQPWFFFFTVFFSGLIMMWMSAYSGAYVTAWIVHAVWNLSILTTTFLGGGYLAITVASVLPLFMVIYDNKIKGEKEK